MERPSSSDLRRQASFHTPLAQQTPEGYPVCPQGLSSDHMAFSLQDLAWPLR